MLAPYELQWSRTQHQPARRLRTLPTFLWAEKMPAQSRCSRSNPDTASSAHTASAPVKAPAEAAAGTCGQRTQSSMGRPEVRQRLAFPEVPTPARQCYQRRITLERRSSTGRLTILSPPPHQGTFGTIQKYFGLSQNDNWQGAILLASSGRRLGRLLNTPQCTEQSNNRE